MPQLLHAIAPQLWPRTMESIEGKFARAGSREKLRATVETRPDGTLAELQRVLCSACKVEVSEPTVCRELQRLELPRKKRASSPANVMNSSGVPSVVKSRS